MGGKDGLSGGADRSDHGQRHTELFLEHLEPLLDRGHSGFDLVAHVARSFALSPERDVTPALRQLPLAPVRSDSRKIRREIHEFMRIVDREAQQQRQAALRADDKSRAEFFDGVTCAVLDCQRNGKPSFGWDDHTELGRGWKRGWALLLLGTDSIRRGAGRIDPLLPSFED